jgi:hypothetical protein
MQKLSMPSNFMIMSSCHAQRGMAIQTTMEGNGRYNGQQRHCMMALQKWPTLSN